MNGQPVSDSLKSMPWQYVEIDGRDFLIKFLATTSFYEVLISDFVSMWNESVDEEQLISRNNILNPDIEISSSRLIHQIQHMIFNRDGTATSLKLKNLNEDTLEITAQISRSSLILNWKLELSRASYTVFAEQLTWPLVTMVAELSRRQQHLTDIIKNKDLQIEDYKAEGIKLMRRYTADEPFDEEAFTTDMILSKEFDNLVKKPCETAFGNNVKALYTAVMKQKMDTLSNDALKVTRNTAEKCPNTVVTVRSHALPDSDKDLELTRRLELEKNIANEKMKNEREKKRKKLNL